MSTGPPVTNFLPYAILQTLINNIRLINLTNWPKSRGLLFVLEKAKSYPYATSLRFRPMKKQFLKPTPWLPLPIVSKPLTLYLY